MKKMKGGIAQKKSTAALLFDDDSGADAGSLCSAPTSEMSERGDDDADDADEGDEDDDDISVSEEEPAAASGSATPVQTPSPKVGVRKNKLARPQSGVDMACKVNMQLQVQIRRYANVMMMQCKYKFNANVTAMQGNARQSTAKQCRAEQT